MVERWANAADCCPPGPDGQHGCREDGVKTMIAVTRLNNRRMVLNAEMIKSMEETPDTMITLINGDHIMVRESLQEVVQRAIEYMRSVRAFVPSPG